MSGRRSRAKGKRGEYEVRDIVREHGFEAERGGPIHGDDKRADTVHDIPGVHIEVKRTERLDLYGAIRQAETDASVKGQEPWVVFRRNDDRGRAIVDFRYLMQLVRAQAITEEFVELVRGDDGPGS